MFAYVNPTLINLHQLHYIRSPVRVQICIAEHRLIKTLSSSKFIHMHWNRNTHKFSNLFQTSLTQLSLCYRRVCRVWRLCAHIRHRRKKNVFVFVIRKDFLWTYWTHHVTFRLDKRGKEGEMKQMGWTLHGLWLPLPPSLLSLSRDQALTI